MKIIEVIVVLILIFVLGKFLVGWSPEEKVQEVKGHQKIYKESQKSLDDSMKNLEKGYEKYEEVGE